MKIMFWLLPAMLCLFCYSNCAAQTNISLNTLLREMTDVDAVARWPQPTYTAMQASSYDRNSVSPDQPGWFANDDRSQYIRTEQVNGRKEQVMMDADGPGAVVRFWLTTFRRNGNIRIYFDGDTEPELVIPAYDLMKSGLPLGKALLEPHSSYEAKEKGGNTLYLPMPYAKHCKITWEDLDTDNQPRYYQVNYRTYPPGTKVETFTLAGFKKLKALADSVDQKLLSPTNTVFGQKLEMNQTILPAAKTSLMLPSGSQAVRLITLKIKASKNEDYEQALRSTMLSIEFDGQQTVWCPVGDFSGSGVGGKQLQSWYRTVSADGTVISRWVMPYQKSAKIMLVNKGAIAIQASLSVVTDKWHWDDRSMYFHADWKNENNVAIKQTEKDKPADWELNAITGKGIFLGDVLAVYNHMHKWYGEGDQKIWTDGAKFPVEFGTGTEDYYNTSWAPVVLYQTPFANAPRADNPDSYGYNTFTRTRNLDGVTFNRSFRYTLETLGWENGLSDFAATTYWYGFKGTKSSIEANPADPGTLPQ